MKYQTAPLPQTQTQNPISPGSLTCAQVAELAQTCELIVIDWP